MKVPIFLPQVLSALIIFLASAGADLKEDAAGSQLRIISEVNGSHDIFKRQLTTTTPRPKKRRPGNIFSLISVLISETRDDASRALNEIGVVFSSQFKNNTGRSTTTTTVSAPPSDNDEENEVTTTTEPYRITREEFNGILRSNFQGLIRLFGKELGNALKDSTQNVRQYGKELRDTIRPYVT